MPTRDFTSTLVSLAMLKVRIDSGRSYLDDIIPFVNYVIRDKNIGDVVGEGEVQEGIKSEFALFVPLSIITLLFGRLAKKGILNLENHQFSIQKIPNGFPNFESERASVQRHTAAVVNEFMEFAEKNYKKVLTKSKSSEIILGFLSEFSIECLATYQANSPFPEDSQLAHSDHIMIGSFIRELRHSKPERFESFSKMLKGHMLTNALLCSSLNLDKFGNVTFYLDTPLIINLLGLNGDKGEKVVSEMIKILVDLKGSVAIFDHTRDEISHFIDWLANSGHLPNVLNQAAVEMKKQRKSRSDMLLLKNRYLSELRRQKIRVIAAPPFDPENFAYQIDEVELENILQDEIKYSRNPDAVKYDVNSVRSIQVLRKARIFDQLEKVNAVFVTSNKSFARAIRRHESQFSRGNSYSVPSVVTDIDVTNIAWLKSPMQGSEILEQRIIENVYTILKPREEFWNNVVAEADHLQKQNLVSEESLMHLRSDPSIVEMVYEKSLGAMDREKIHDILKQTELDRQAEIRNLKENISDQIEANQAMRKQQNANCDSIAKKLAWVPTGIFALLVFPFWAILDSPLAGILVFIAAVLNAFGLTIPKIRKWTVSKISSFLKKNILGNE